MSRTLHLSPRRWPWLPSVAYSLPVRARDARAAPRRRRRVLRRDLGSPEPGRHVATLGGEPAPPPATTWLRIVQAGRTSVAKTVILRLVSRPRSSLPVGCRCIPAGCVAPPRRIQVIRLRRRALPAGPIGSLGGQPTPGTGH